MNQWVARLLALLLVLDLALPPGVSAGSQLRRETLRVQAGSESKMKQRLATHIDTGGLEETVDLALLERFGVSQRSQTRILDNFLVLLERQSKGGTTAELAGLTYTKKGPNWQVQISDGAYLKVGLIAAGAILPIQSDEKKIIIDSLQQSPWSFGTKVALDVAAAMNRHLDNLRQIQQVAGNPSVEVELEGVVYRLAASGSWPAWVYPDSAEQSLVRRGLIAAGAILPITSDESKITVEVLQESPWFLGYRVARNTAASINRHLDNLWQIQQAAGNPSAEVELEGVVYRLAVSGTSQVWAYPSSADQALVRKSLIAAGAILPITSDESKITRDIFQEPPWFFGGGVAKETANALSNHLDNLWQIQQAAGNPSAEVELEGVVYRLAVSGTQPVWTYPNSADQALVRSGLIAAGAILPITSDESRVIQIVFQASPWSFKQKTAVFAAAAMNRHLDNLWQIQQAAGNPSSEVELGGVVYRRAVSGNHLVWTYPNSADQALVRKGLIAAGAILPVQDHEARITKRSLQESPWPFGEGIAEAVAAAMNRHLDNLWQAQQDAQEPSSEVELKGVVYRRAVSGNHSIWVYPNATDPSLVKQGFIAAGAILPMREDESKITVGALKESPWSLGDKVALDTAAAMNRHLDNLWQIQQAAGNPSAEVELKGVVYRRAVSVSHPVWTYPNSADQALVRKGLIAAGAILPMQEDEIGVIQRTLQVPSWSFGVTTAVEAAASMNRHLDNLWQIQQAAGNPSAEVELQGVVYRLAVNWTSQVWAYPSSADQALVRKGLIAAGAILPMAEDESKITGENFMQAPWSFDHRLAYDAARALNDCLDNLWQAQQAASDFSVVVVTGGISYRKGSFDTWVYPSSHVRLVRAKLVALGVPGIQPASEVLDDELNELGLDDAVALIGGDQGDAWRLLEYLRLTQPGMTPGKQISLVAHSGRSMGIYGEVPVHHETYQKTGQLVLDPIPQQTDASYIELTGRADGMERVQIRGIYFKTAKVSPDGSFRVRLPLARAGQVHYFQLYGYSQHHQIRTPPVEIDIKSTRKPVPEEESLLGLLELRENLLHEIQLDATRRRILLQNLEISRLKQFTVSEQAGFDRLQAEINAEQDQTRKTLLEAVRGKFLLVRRVGQDLHRPLLFHQKYTIYEALRLMEEQQARDEPPGVVIANEPGSGKTAVGNVLLADTGGLMLTPNSVVDFVVDEHGKMYGEDSHLVRLEGPYLQRDVILQNSSLGDRVVVNVEFARGIEGDRLVAVHNVTSGRTFLVDEGLFLTRTSQQTEGTRRVQAHRRIIMSATPISGAADILKLMQFLHPDDLRFASMGAFKKVFLQSTAADDPQAVRMALRWMLRRIMIRLRKRDIAQEAQPDDSSEVLRYRLPRKEFIDPDALGAYTPLPQQVDRLHGVFSNFNGWVDTHTPAGDDRRYERDGHLPRKHVVRQLLNDPHYDRIETDRNPKRDVMDLIAQKELGPEADATNKTVVVVKYQAQAQAYHDRYKERYGARMYSGLLKQNSQGYKMSEQGVLEYYRVDPEGRYVLGKDHRPIRTFKSDPHSQPIRALEYERLVFQNDPTARMIIVSEDVGAFGVTFTAANSMVLDDLPETYVRLYQLWDRIHRIDLDRPSPVKRYYRLEARFDQDYVNRQSWSDTEKSWFRRSFDEVQWPRLQSMGDLFHFLVDLGISEEEVEREFTSLSEAMPWMFPSDETEDDLATAETLEQDGQIAGLEEPDAIQDEEARAEREVGVIRGVLKKRVPHRVSSESIGRMMLFSKGALEGGEGVPALAPLLLELPSVLPASEWNQIQERIVLYIPEPGEAARFVEAGYGKQVARSPDDILPLVKKVHPENLTFYTMGTTDWLLQGQLPVGTVTIPLTQETFSEELALLFQILGYVPPTRTELEPLSEALLQGT